MGLRFGGEAVLPSGQRELSLSRREDGDPPTIAAMRPLPRGVHGKWLIGKAQSVFRLDGDGTDLSISQRGISTVV
jgi:hypothetical protein